MDSIDLQLLRKLENGLPLVSHPYAQIGREIGLSEDEVIHRLEDLKKAGIIRRVGARINQRKLGITANALVAWNIPESESDKAGEIFAKIPGVTHCYRRAPVPDKWDYSLYTVHHNWSQTLVLEEVTRISKMTGYSDYRILFSTDEFKRVPHTRPDDIEVHS